MLEITIDDKVYKFDQNRLMNTEIKAIQKMFGVSLAEFAQIDRGNVDAIDALVWLVRTRDGEKDLKPEDIVYNMAGIDFRDLDAPAKETDDASDPSVLSPSEPSPLTLDES
jgi:hypothetical protein